MSFGADSVFLDIDSIPLGLDFRAAIDKAVGKCDVLLAVIGPSWFGWDENKTSRRIDRPNDYLRLEIEAALRRGIPVVPILVDSTPIPEEQDLVESLRPLLYRQASVFRPTAMHADRDRTILLNKLKHLLDRSAPIDEPQKVDLLLAALLRRHRQMAIAKAPLSWRLPVLRSIRKADPMNSAWADMATRRLVEARTGRCWLPQ